MKFTAAICDVRAGCTALFSYFDAPIPIVRRRAANEFDVYVLGGNLGKVHAKVVTSRNQTKSNFSIKHVVGRATPNQVALFPRAECKGGYTNQLDEAP